MYQKAHKYLKCYLQFAYYLNLNEEELKAYDKLGICYYLMGNLDMAKDCHDRMLNGIVEKESSNLRIIAIKTV
jgi:hypothetical protein